MTSRGYPGSKRSTWGATGGREGAAEKDLWTLWVVARVVLEHFGVASENEKGRV